MRQEKIAKVLKDIISFGTPQARVFNLASIIFLLAAVPTRLLKYSPVKCIYKNFLLPLIFRGDCPTIGVFANCECPACGLTRAMSRLLHGDIAGAWDFNKLVFAVFFVIIVLVIINSVKVVRHYKETGKIY